MWDALVAARVALPNGSFVRGSQRDRRYLGTLLKVIHRNGRKSPLLKDEGSAPRLARLILKLDSGLTPAVTIALLAEQGICDLPAEHEVPPIADK